MSGAFLRKKPAIGWAGLVLTGVALAALGAAGCSSDAPAPAPVPGSQATAAADNRIQIADPIDMADEVLTQPLFKWRLPSTISVPTTVTFTLAEAGQGDQPIRGDAALQQKQIVIVSGLAEVSPTQLDLFNLPAGCNPLWTGPALTQLKPHTWYGWTVRATEMGTPGGKSLPKVAHGEAFFRTHG
jgi:hypothetical protein